MQEEEKWPRVRLVPLSTSGRDRDGPVTSCQDDEGCQGTVVGDSGPVSAVAATCLPPALTPGRRRPPGVCVLAEAPDETSCCDRSRWTLESPAPAEASSILCQWAVPHPPTPYPTDRCISLQAEAGSLQAASPMPHSPMAHESESPRSCDTADSVGRADSELSSDSTDPGQQTPAPHSPANARPGPHFRIAFPRCLPGPP